MSSQPVEALNPQPIVLAEKSSVPKSPAQLLELAVSQGANVDQLAKLMDLQLRWQAEEARLAWIDDMSAFKAECPEILRTKHVKQTSKKEGVSAPEYWHAELDKACEILIPILSKHNFTHRWECETSKDGIVVTCVIQHKMGHSERTQSPPAPPDATGGKNAVQAIGSTKYYLERYTFFAALGIAPKGQDTDGVPQGIPTHRRAEQVEWIQNCRSAEELTRVWKGAHEEAAAVRDYDAIRLYIEAKARRKDELFRGDL